MPFPEIDDPKRQLQVNGREATRRVRHVKLDRVGLSVREIQRIIERAIQGNSA